MRRASGLHLFESIPTFDEVIELAQAWSDRLGRVIGVYPETKHSTYHQSVNLPLHMNGRVTLIADAPAIEGLSA